MSNQYQPTSYYDWVNRTHGVHLNSGDFQYVPYDYYAGDELHIQNVVFRDSQYVTYDHTHVRFLNKSDIHVYDTSSLVIHDSGTLSMYTSASNSARKFVVDEHGRVGIGLDHADPVSNRGESPSFDLDVRGQVGVEDFIYHNDDIDTYMLFGSDLSAHNVNADGSINTIYPDDQDEINFRVGGIDILQMQTRDVAHLESGTTPTGVQDHLTINKYQSDVDVVIRTVDEPNMLFIDSKNNRISIGDSEDVPAATLEVTNDPDSGAFDVPLVQLNNEDTDKQLLDINAKNINADVINVHADDLTTGDVLNTTADKLTTGSLIHMTHTGSDKSEVSLVHFESTGDRGDNNNQTVLLDLNFDTTAGTGARALRIDSEQTTGKVFELDASEITSGQGQLIDMSKMTTGEGLGIFCGARTTGTGMNVYDTHTSDDAGILVSIQQYGDRAGSAASIGVNIDFNTTSNANARAFKIDSEQTTGVVAEIDANKITTGTALFVDADALTTGTILNLDSNSSSTTSRNLVRIHNDNTSATGARALYIINDAIASGDSTTNGRTETVRFESTAADLNPLLELRNSNTATDTPPILNFIRSANNEVEDMCLGTITFEGKDGDNTDTVYAAISARATDIDNTREAGEVSILVQAAESSVNSTLKNLLRVGKQESTGGPITTQAEVVVNEDSIDCDFRVESTSNTNAFTVYGDGTEVVVNDQGNSDTDFRVESDKSDKMLQVDASADLVTIQGPANDDTDVLTIKGNGNNNQAGHELLSITPVDTIFNDDGNDIDFRIESNTNSSAFWINGDGSEVVINDTGQSDTDFRVESNSSPASATDTHPTRIGHKKSHALFVDTSTGNVGLGVSNPNTTLHVAGSAHIEGDLWIKGNTNQIDTLVYVTSAMDITNMGTGPALKVTQTGSQPVAAFYDAEHTSGPAFYIENNGNVGIGDSDPDTVLHIKSTAPVITLEDITGVETQWHQSKISSDDSTGALHLMADTTDKKANSFISFRIDGTGSTNEKARITDYGRLGLGTTTPENYDTEASMLVIKDTGNTGMTIAAGDAKRSNIYFADGESGGKEYMGGITYDHGDDNLSLRTNKVERVWISSAGNVGVGVDEPTCKLDVQSTIRAVSGAQVAPTSGSGLEMFANESRGYLFNFNRDTGAYHDLQLGNSLYLPQSTTPTKAGNVGINISNPHTKLYIKSTDGLRIPIGTTAQRPTSAAFDITGAAETADFSAMHGTIRYNTENKTFEGFGAGDTWGSLGGVIDTDRDTYWTAVNDLNDLHDPGETSDVAGQYGTDEFTDTDYPGDVDYLRAFTQGVKRLAITPTGDTKFYWHAGGTGSVGDPYVYDTSLTINPNTDGVELVCETLQKNVDIKTSNIPNNSDAQAGDIKIQTGSAIDRALYSGSGGDGGDIYISAGDGANGWNTGSGGDGGDVIISSGDRGNKTVSQSPVTDGAYGKITLEGVNCKTHFNFRGVELLESTNFTIKDSTATTPLQMFKITGSSGRVDAKKIYAEELSLTTDLAVAHGGTGVSTLADKSVCVTQDSGTDQVKTKVMTTNGALLIGGSDGPETATLTAGTDITITDAKNSITIAHGSTGATTNPTVTAVNRTFVKSIAVDNRGHVTGIGTGEEADTATRASLGIDTDDNVTFNSVLVGATTTTGVEGGEIQINCTTDITPYYLDTYKDVNNSYGHGADEWIFRIFSDTAALTFDATNSTLRNVGDIVAFSSSDSKYKDNLTPIPDALNKTMSLTGYEFDWNDKQTTYTGHDVGVVAQEVEQVLPEIVETRDNDSKAVRYEKMIPLLIESIKEQQSQIDTLKAEIEQLKQQ